MPIITREDMVARFGQAELAELTDHEDRTDIDDAVLAHAIADAEAEAGSYLLAARVVITTPPKALIIRVCDIARYYLYENGVTEIVEDRYKQAIAWLKDVVRNPAMLGVDTPAQHGSHGIVVQANDTPAWKDL